MLQRLHEHIVEELGHSTRTDTILIVVGIAFNLIVLGINSAAAGSSNSFRDNYGQNYNVGDDIILAIFILVTLLVNFIAVAGLFLGRSTRAKLLGGLIAMYKDNKVAKYYDSTLVSNYRTRYILFSGLILLLGLTAMLVPLVIRFL